jgi:hypothetical protein
LQERSICDKGRLHTLLLLLLNLLLLNLLLLLLLA